MPPFIFAQSLDKAKHYDYCLNFVKQLFILNIKMAYTILLTLVPVLGQSISCIKMCSQSKDVCMVHAIVWSQLF